MDAADQVGPMADNARDAAAHRMSDARIWAAPRLDRAAHSVEDELAPKVSAFLADAARRMDPKPAKSRRWPMMVLICGLAVGTAGYMMYRRNAERWTDSMKETAADASQWVSEKADGVGHRTDDMSKKMS
ncbi:DUF5324 family protein [Streptosporangium sp. KLBMP 9127]|nr:DUF5324 family protein [Streptosporangium sp. KLBMP 9127]